MTVIMAIQWLKPERDLVSPDRFPLLNLNIPSRDLPLLSSFYALLLGARFGLPLNPMLISRLLYYCCLGGEMLQAPAP